jgi:hypothetical protein
MPADVVEAAQSSVGAAHEQQRLTDEGGREKVAGIRDLAGVTNDLPRSREDLFSFGKKNARVGIKMRGQSPGSRDLGVDMKLRWGIVHG